MSDEAGLKLSALFREWGPWRARVSFALVRAFARVGAMSRQASKRLPPNPHTAPSSSSSSSSSSASVNFVPLSTSGLPITSHTYSKSPLDDMLAQNGLHRYHLEPPSWRPPWTTSSNANDGSQMLAGNSRTYPQFYPTVDGQDEDQMTEQAVKQGFTNKARVQVSCGRRRLIG